MALNEKFYNIFHDQIVGGNVVFIKNQDEIKYHYGYRSLLDNKPTEDDTIYRIASISKLVIGLTAMKVVEEGLLDLDKDISTIFGYLIRNPKFPNTPITTRMLMLHTSSITDGQDDVNPNRGYNGVNGQHYFVALEDLLVQKQSKFYTDKTYSDYEPGTKYVYSNFGAGIIACIIEKVGRQLFTEFVAETFFKPLHMDASFKASQIIRKDKISDTFTGFVTNKTAKAFIDGTYPDFQLGNNFRGPAGGLFVSMQDLSKIMMVLMNDGKYQERDILNKQSIDTLFEMNFFARRHYEDKQLILNGYSGGAYGVCSVLYFSKLDKTGICFIANGGNYIPASTGLTNIQEAIINVLIEELS